MTPAATLQRVSRYHRVPARRYLLAHRTYNALPRMSMADGGIHIHVRVLLW